MMALSTFPQMMSNAAETVILTANRLRNLRDGSGAIQLSDIDAINRALRSAKSSSVNAIAEGQKRPVDAEAFMASIGGPSTMDAFQAAIANLDAAAAAWVAAWKATVEALDVADLISVQTVTAGGVQSTQIVRIDTIPDPAATSLRQNQALADLIATFEAYGG